MTGEAAAPGVRQAHALASRIGATPIADEAGALARTDPAEP